MSFRPPLVTNVGSYQYYGRMADEVTLEGYYYGFVRSFNETMIAAFRNFFDHNPRPLIFFAKDRIKLHIAEAWPTEPMSFPAIMIERTDINLKDVYLGSKLGAVYEKRGDIYTEVGEARGGQARINTSLKVGTYTTPQRDAIADMIVYALVAPLCLGLNSKGLVQIPDSIVISAESMEEPDKIGKTIYTRSVSVSYIGEWFDIFYFNGIEITDYEIHFSRG